MQMISHQAGDTQDLEIRLLVEALHSQYGYDFSQYAYASFKRRVLGILKSRGLKQVSELIPPLLYEPGFCEALVAGLTVQVTEMFRDPWVFKTLREQVIPVLKTWPFVKIWIAGCATGEEVYSLAILLHEEGLYDRVRLFATDISREALQTAEEGIYPLDQLEAYQDNYQQAGGKNSFSDYYSSSYHLARMDDCLRQNILFSRHNLAVDNVFSEVHLVLCRNVMIYFERDLQDRALNLFRESLAGSGVLCLGSKESLEFSNVSDKFSPLDTETNDQIYSKRSLTGVET